MLCISAAYAVVRRLTVCLSVCLYPSVTFVYYIKTNKHILNLFHHRAATSFCRSFHTKPYDNTPTEPPPLNEDVECGWGIFDQYLILFRK